MVKQTGRVRPPLNATLVDVVMRSILPPSPQHLSASDVRDAIETHLQSREEDIWVGWTVKDSNVKKIPGWMWLMLNVVSVFNVSRLEIKYPRT